ncbi:NAD(P)H-dependent oxidoreductase [Aestuariibius sp. HNIBRBA575]|uniref:NAD(P)H-dependent oxidoreductase n=1 Tax=Aestuariibius sp. HNIBRBA575 TaxID=3233343 RepID=UPI0034A34FA7
MSAKRILVLNGHPAETSLSKSLAEKYTQSAQEAGHDVRVLHLRDFDLDYGFGGYSNHKPLEPCLLAFQADVDWAQHVVLLTPMWWGGMPAKLKGLFDRTLLPGWAFDTRTTKMGMPLPLLGGRTARAIVTSDTPTFLFGLMYHRSLLRQIKGQILHFIGMKPAKITHFAPASKAKPELAARWLNKVGELGRQGV